MESFRQNGKAWRLQTPSSRRLYTSDWEGVTRGIGGKSGKRRWQENHPRGEFQGECRQEVTRETAKETEMYRTDFQTLRETERVG